MSRPPSLSTRFFRASASYRLVEPRALQCPLAPWLATQSAHPAFGGLLVPVHDDFRVQRVVTRATARLFQNLTRPQRAPTSVPQRALRGMVLDGVLELRDGMRYVSGAAAQAQCLPVKVPVEPRSAIAALSLDALQQCAALELTSPSVLARLLYSFNSLPVTPSRRGVGSDSSSLERALRRAVPNAAGDPEVHGAGAWLSWEIAGPPPDGARVWKLYLSPLPGQLAPALTAASHQRDAFSMKVGRDLYNILRPDKLVLYFTTPRHLRRAARQLAQDLAGLPAQGVPFTGGLGDTALLSWGVDPAGKGSAAPWLGDDSWRAWLTQRLATAVVQALRDPGCAVPPWQYAMSRVSLDGVEIRNWAPRAGSTELQRTSRGDQ